MRMSDSIKELAIALVAVQAEMTPLKKDKNNYFNQSYVGLDTVMPEALAILSKNGIAITQTVGTAGDGLGTTLTTTLLHVSGQWLTDTQPLLLVKQDAQGQGSAITYARRYGVMSALGIVAEEDDDGNKASKRPATRRKATARPTPPKTTAAPPMVDSTGANEAPDPQQGLGRNTGQATEQQIDSIERLVDDWKGGDERAACLAVHNIMPAAVNKAGTALVLKTLTQDEAGKLIVGIQDARRPKRTAAA